MDIHSSTPNHSRFDLLIKNADVVLESGLQRFDIGILNGTIAALEQSLAQPADQILDAAGKLVFPGFIDAHTHQGIPIKDTFSADDFDSGSIAAACGGVTTILDFTVQEKGQSIRQALEARIEKARGKCHVDFGVHVNITDQPERWLSQIRQLISEGFSSFKVFSTYREAGMMVTREQFRRILRQVNAHGGLLMLHAEENSLIEATTEKYLAAQQFRPIYHARSRTSEAEASAIAKAAEIAGELDAPLYIVHLSSRAGLECALQAKEQGVKLYLETCPQYLLLDESKYLGKNGHYFITTPPLRTADDREALWEALTDELIDVVATDHCPFTMAQKDSGGGQFHRTPNGLPGVETLFPLLYTYGVCEGRIKMSRLLEVLAQNPAHIFGISDRKGEIRIGADADLVIWDPREEWVIPESGLHGNADWSPYAGLKIAGCVDHTILRGQVLVQQDRVYGESVYGELISCGTSMPQS